MWTDLVDRSSFLYQAFGGAPSLEGVRIEEISLSADGRKLRLRFDLADFPSPPPRKWEKYNTVQIALEFYNLATISVAGFDFDKSSDITILQQDESVSVQVTGAVDLNCSAQGALLSDLSAYLKP